MKELESSRRKILTSLGIGATSLLSGCSGETPEEGGESTPTESSTASATPTEEPSPTDTEAEPTETAEEEPEVGPEAVDLYVSDQTNEKHLTIEKVETEVDVRLEILDEQDGSLAPSVFFEAGSVIEDYQIAYTTPLERKQEVTVRLIHNDSVLSATSVTIRPGIIELTQGEVNFIDAEPARGFNYPYFAYIPENLESNGPVMVEPNNTGTSTDDFTTHRDAAEDLLTEDSWNRKLHDYLAIPSLVPVFPRPRNDPVDWSHYVHALDAETMSIDDGKLDRVDLQLLAMVDHYRESLEYSFGFVAPEEFHLNGFSASGNFVNRFTGIHPERVQAATAGGVNGTLLLPLEEFGGQTLPYPIGVANLPELIGSDFDHDAWAAVPQFVYMGAEDTNDTIPYDDAWNSRLREIALEVYGEDMQKERMPFCESVYNDAGANAQIHVYQNIGHQIPRWVQRDVFEFHRAHMDENGEFDPIQIRDAPALEVSFAEAPSDGDTSIEIHVSIPGYYKIRDKFSDGSVSVMLDDGDEIEWGDRIQLSGNRHFRPQDLPSDETRTYEIDRPLDSGEQITVGLMDGMIITAETVTVE